VVQAIESYDFGRVVIGGRAYTSDVLVFPEGVKERWWRREGHKLCLEDLREALERKPKVLVVGTGYSGLMEVTRGLREELRAKGIELKAAPTREAVELYNELKGPKVVAALHLTC